MITNDVVLRAQKKVENFLLTGLLTWNPESGRVPRTFTAVHGSRLQISFTLLEPRDNEFHITVRTYKLNTAGSLTEHLSTDNLIPFTLEPA